MTVSVERINDAAKVLDELFLENADQELGGDIWFSNTAQHLKRLAELRAPKKPKVYVSYSPRDTAVYVEKPDGTFAAIYVGAVYEHTEDDGFDTGNGVAPCGVQVFGD